MAEFRPAGDIKPTDARSTFLKKVKQENTKKLADEMRRKANRGPLMKGSDGKVSGKTFDKGKGTAALPRAKELPSKTGVLGGSGVQGTGVGSERKITFGANAKERDFYRGDSAPPKPKAKPATDKSRLAGKKAEKVVQGSAKAATPAKKVSDFALATRRGRSDEYIKASMRPKGNLMSLFKSKASNKSTSSGAARVTPLTSSFAKKNLAANQKIGKKQ